MGWFDGTEMEWFDGLMLWWDCLMVGWVWFDGLMVLLGSVFLNSQPRLRHHNQCSNAQSPGNF